MPIDLEMNLAGGAATNETIASEANDQDKAVNKETVAEVDGFKTASVMAMIKCSAMIAGERAASADHKPATARVNPGSSFTPMKST
jgi:hypothetical protein